MKGIGLLLVIAGALGWCSPGVKAATVWATTNEGFAQGTAINGGFLPGRSDPTSALGAPDGAFVSLGFGGTIDLGFGTLFGPPVAFVVETTNGTYPLEIAEVWTSLDDITYVRVESSPGVADTVDNAGDTTAVISTGPWKYLRIVDITDSSLFTGYANADGFDLNAAGVTPVPVPLAVWGGMALFGVLAVPKLRKLRQDGLSLG